MRKTSIALILGIFSFFTISCEEDPIEVGSEIFGEDQFGFERYAVSSIQSDIISTGAIGTRNLQTNPLGIYDHQVFGKTVAHFVTQIGMAGTDTNSNALLSDIGSNPVLDSVYVYIPYNSTVSSTDSDNNSTYTLNNVYGDGSFSLNVYENGYYLRNQDPSNDLEQQQYYNDQKSIFDNNKKGINGANRLNDSENQIQNVAFRATADPIILYQYNADGTERLDDDGNKVEKERKAPGVWLDLNTAYFQERFFENATYTQISNNNQLRTYFRGLYFNVESNSPLNHLIQLDLTGGQLVFVYKEDGADDERVRKEFRFNIGFSTTTGNVRSNTTVSLIENTFSSNYQNALSIPQNNTLWVKGNEGSIATIDLLSEAELDEIRAKNWMINQAVLTMYVDRDAFSTEESILPTRLYLYDLKNNLPIIDFNTDQTTSPLKQIYNGFLDSSESGALKYRFRITDHINNLIQKDSTNTQLGLVAVSNVNNVLFTTLKNSNTTTSRLPVISAEMPFGAVLYGANHQDLAKRMKLEIYYTKEN